MGLFPRVYDMLDEFEKQVELVDDQLLPKRGINADIDGVLEKMNKIKLKLDKIL